MGGKGGSMPAPPPVQDSSRATEEFMQMMIPMFSEMTKMVSTVMAAPAPEPTPMPSSLQMPTIEPYIPVDWESEYQKMQDQATKNTQDDLSRKNSQDKTVLTSPLLAQAGEEMKSLLGETLKKRSGQVSA